MLEQKNLSLSSPALKSPPDPLPLRFSGHSLQGYLSNFISQILLLTLFQPHLFFYHVLTSPMALALCLGELALSMVGFNCRQEDEAEKGWSWGEFGQQSWCPKGAFDQAGAATIAKHLSWWLGRGSRDYRGPRFCLGLKSRRSTPRKEQTSPPCGVRVRSSCTAFSTGVQAQGSCEREITKDKLPWPMEVEGRLEEFSGHGLGALNLGW